jgi:hypothetical protein
MERLGADPGPAAWEWRSDFIGSAASDARSDALLLIEQGDHKFVNQWNDFEFGLFSDFRIGSSIAMIIMRMDVIMINGMILSLNYFWMTIAIFIMRMEVIGDYNYRW